MLALAHPVHDTPTSSTVSKSASRPKPVVVVRRTPSTTVSVSASTSASSSSLPAYSSSASSTTASASSFSSASASRSSSLLPQSRTVPSSSSAKHDAILPHASSSSSSRSAPQRQQQGHSQHVAEQRTPPTSSTHAPHPVRPRSTTPIDIHSYPPTDLLRLLASLLNQIAQANDALSPHATQSPSAAPQTIPPAYSPTQEECPIWHTLTTAARQALSTSTSPLSFHARNIPSISLEAYLLRILRYCPTTNEVFLSLLVYFDRMSKLAQEATGHRFAIDSYNVHRLVIAGVTVASKFFSDVFYTNSRYAKVGGLPQAELNQLELQFLLLNDFRLVISPDEMQRYADQLVAFSESQSRHSDANNSIPQIRPPIAPVPIPIDPQQPTVYSGSGPTHSNSLGTSRGISEDNSTTNVHRNSTPRHSATAVAPVSAYFPEDERDPDSSVCSETDTDAETDDEPTIRANHSCASSETQSVCSTNDDDDDDNDADDPRFAFMPARRPPHVRRWTDASAEVAADDGRMHSP